MAALCSMFGFGPKEGVTQKMPGKAGAGAAILAWSRLQGYDKTCCDQALRNDH